MAHRQEARVCDRPAVAPKRTGASYMVPVIASYGTPPRRQGVDGVPARPFPDTALTYISTRKFKKRKILV